MPREKLRHTAVLVLVYDEHAEARAVLVRERVEERGQLVRSPDRGDDQVERRRSGTCHDRTVSSARRTLTRSSQPLVSFVLAAHDAAGTLGAALESVLRQTVDDLELVVVDDGSTDATP